MLAVRWLEETFACPRLFASRAAWVRAAAAAGIQCSPQSIPYVARHAEAQWCLHRDWERLVEGRLLSERVAWLRAAAMLANRRSALANTPATSSAGHQKCASRRWRDLLEELLLAKRWEALLPGRRNGRWSRLLQRLRKVEGWLVLASRAFAALWLPE